MARASLLLATVVRRSRPARPRGEPTLPARQLSPRPAVAAAAFDAGPIKTAAEYLGGARARGARTPARGELLGFACAACHRFRADEGTLIGPHLHGVFGRLGRRRVAGFAYSPALDASPGSSGRRVARGVARGPRRVRRRARRWRLPAIARPRIGAI